MALATIMIFTRGERLLSRATRSHAVGPSDLYPNLITQINASKSTWLQWQQRGQLAFGPVSLNGQAGNRQRISMQAAQYFHKVCCRSAALCSGRIRRIPPLSILPNGNVDVSCGSINSPCTKTLSSIRQRLTSRLS